MGEITNEQMYLNECGTIADLCWRDIPNHFPNTDIDEYIIMPNHMHGIIILNETVGAEYIQPGQPAQNTFQHVIPRSLGSIIRSYKAAVTRECRKKGIQYFHWQRNYYEHIIRTEKALNAIRDYILYNPLQWALTHEKPSHHVDKLKTNS